MRCKACNCPPAERNVLTRPATLLSMSMRWLLSHSSGSVLIAGVKVSWLRPLHVKHLSQNLTLVLNASFVPYVCTESPSQPNFRPVLMTSFDWQQGSVIEDLPIERQRLAAERMALQVALTGRSAANAKSISTAVTISALPRLSALCTASLFALGMNSSTRPAPASLQHLHDVTSLPILCQAQMFWSYTEYACVSLRRWFSGGH